MLAAPHRTHKELISKVSEPVSFRYSQSPPRLSGDYCFLSSFSEPLSLQAIATQPAQQTWLKMLSHYRSDRRKRGLANAVIIVNRNVQANGDYEVQNTTTGCRFIPLLENQVSPGDHLSCTDAVSIARGANARLRFNGCYYCCNPATPARFLAAHSGGVQVIHALI